MAKKKKKSRASDEAKSPSVRHSPHLQVSVELPAVEDLISSKLIKSSSSPNRSLKYSPLIILTEHDADRLDVLAGDQVVLISTTDDGMCLQVKSAAVAAVRTASNGPGTPGSLGTGQRSKLSPGHCHVFPVSLANTLSESGEPSKAPIPATPATPIPKPTPAAATPSPSKSKFSFAKGGGGDALISPSAAPSPKSPVKSSYSPSRQLWVIPLDSSLGANVAQLLCREATYLHLEDPSNRLVQNRPLLQRLALAHMAGAHVGLDTSLTVSFQGQPIECTVQHVEEKSGSEAEYMLVNLSQLSLEDSSTEEAMLLKALRSMNESETRSLLLYKVTYQTKIEFGQEESSSRANQELVKQPLLAGLDATIEQVQAMLSTPLHQPHLFHGSLRPPRGVLLHGPGGVGKSSMALQIAQNLESTVNVEHVNCTSLQSETAIVGQAEQRLSQLFRSAERPREGKCGTLLILDDVHLICPKRKGTDPGADRLSSTLLALLDGIGGSGSSAKATVVILAIVTNPSLLDPALRRPGRLDAEVEVPLPDEPATRAEILRFQLDSLGGSATVPEDTWLSLARLAKGFTGADCKLAVKEALRNAVLHRESDISTSDTIEVSIDNLEKAIRLTKPSAIKSVTVEIPEVHWSSIGGMEQVKRELREAIELPLTHGHIFQQLRIRPPRGVLLYGPPGCSKTLMARALATEGHMNFLAVKGPELLSKWLGESERALASLFKRARLASPSIIFFDEIDAIASKRGGSSSGGERLLSQLLTELDGVQNDDDGGKKQRVVVVGATNRPDLLDSALMRPGRIDRMIYVGVPDEESRAGIFALGLKDKACAGDINVSIYCFVPLFESRTFLIYLCFRAMPVTDRSIISRRS
jgi:transitional endoplasmic reticulum ATPase